jgi:C1A family cysteine protease
MKRSLKGFGWIPDLPDHRDKRFGLVMPTGLPVRFNLADTGFMPPVFSQGQTSSCTGNSTAGAVQFMHAKEGLPAPAFSRLFLYYNGRVLESGEQWDQGASIRDVFKGLNTEGVCEEITWPFDENQVVTKPSENAYLMAEAHVSVEYASMSQDLVSLKTCIATGFPFVFGFSVYESFMADPCRQFGIVTMPDRDNESLVGGHAVWAYAFDDTKQTFRVRNSWGKGWGASGDFFLPYAYISNPDLACDFWTIKLIK